VRNACEQEAFGIDPDTCRRDLQKKESKDLDMSKGKSGVCIGPKGDAVMGSVGYHSTGFRVLKKASGRWCVNSKGDQGEKAMKGRGNRLLHREKRRQSVYPPKRRGAGGQQGRLESHEALHRGRSGESCRRH